MVKQGWSTDAQMEFNVLKANTNEIEEQNLELLIIESKENRLLKFYIKRGETLRLSFLFNNIKQRS